ncbi:MAG: sterol desaturase family protein [Leptospiraceae bacterium]|nr:sterol desaturase family protein [Leptospiraceae bacterium]MCP5495253.1 sterol desaturase family protein [Leptospiraceae bacterium]
MNLNIMEYMFPIMLFLIATEFLFSYYQKRSFYRVNILISDTSTGIIFAIAGVAILAGALYVYSIVETNFSLSTAGITIFTMESPIQFAPNFSIKIIPLLSWVAALVIVDFFYYWFHRLTHEINILWACHVTHHSSEEMNLSVSFRGNAFQRIFEYMFYLPLAVIGLPWVMFLLCHRIMKIYQFIVHTRYVGKLGFLEYFLVTPSSHRVHHGTEPKYLDRNHGGIFILWDKWFGTFEEEGNEPLYGITKPLNSFNPIWGNVHIYSDIIRDMKQARSWKDKLGIMFRKPGWKPDYLKTPEDELKVPAYTAKYNPIVPKWVTYYSFIQAVVVIFIGLATWKIADLEIMPVFLTISLFVYVLFGLVSINGILEKKSWANKAELIRNIIFASGSVAIFSMKIFASMHVLLPYIFLLAAISFSSVVVLISKRKDLSLSF